jgi:hypothetical protein
VTILIFFYLARRWNYVVMPFGIVLHHGLFGQNALHG